MSLNLLIVDDHPMLRYGLRDALSRDPQFMVAGEAGTGAQAVKLANELKPDLVVMDVGLPDMNGAEVTRQVLAAHPMAKVVIFSSDTSRASVDEALEAGACGYLVKSSSVDELISAIGQVMMGKLYLSSSVSVGILEDYRNSLINGNEEPKSSHTDREKRLLQLVSSGCRNKEIASQMGVSVKTVETYRSRLMKRLNCSNTAELVRYAIREGIAAP